MKEPAHPLDPIFDRLKWSNNRRTVRIIFWCLIAFYCYNFVPQIPAARVYVEDSDPTATSLRYYAVSVNGNPLAGVDYSGELVDRNDPRLQFRDTSYRIGYFEKHVERLENGECSESFNPPGRTGILTKWESFASPSRTWISNEKKLVASRNF